MRIRYNSWHHSPVAQSVERLAVNQLVAGSSPARGAILDRSRFPSGKRLLFLYTPCLSKQVNQMVYGRSVSISRLSIVSSNTRNRATSAFPACLASRTVRQPFGRVRVSGRLHQDTSGSLADVFRCAGGGHSVLCGMIRSCVQIGPERHRRPTCQCTSCRDGPAVSIGAGDAGHALLAQGILPRRCA